MLRQLAPKDPWGSDLVLSPEKGNGYYHKNHTLEMAFLAIHFTAPQPRKAAFFDSSTMRFQTQRVFLCSNGPRRSVDRSSRHRGPGLRHVMTSSRVE